MSSTRKTMHKYKSMLLMTSAHKHKYHSQSRLLSNRVYKHITMFNPRNRRRNLERDHLTQWMTTRSMCTGMISKSWLIVYVCSTLRTEKVTTLTTIRCNRSSKNFAKRSYYKLNRVSNEYETNRSSDIEKEYIIFLYLCITVESWKRNLMKREKKLAPRDVSSSRNCMFLREKIFRQGAS